MERTGVVDGLLGRPCTAQDVQAGDHPGRQGDDQLRLGAVVLLAEVAPAVQQVDGLCPAGRLEAGVRVPGAALGIGGVHRHLAGEQALLQGRVGLNGYAQLLAGGQQLLFDAAGQQAVLLLNDVQLAVFAVAADEVGGGVGCTDGPDLALLFELHHGLDGLFQREDGEVRRLPVGVQHVQMVGAEAAQAVFHILDDALGGEVAVGLHTIHDLVENRAFVPPLEAALGGEDDLVPVDVAQSLAHHLFAVVKAVDGGSVDPDDALLHGSLDGLYRQGIVIVAPPASAADGPCAQPQKGGRKAAFANITFFHRSITFFASGAPERELLGLIVVFLMYSKKSCRAGALHSSSWKPVT